MVTYTQEIATEICARLAEGESLRGICKDKHLPSEAAVRGWVMDDMHGFASHYARSRKIGYERLAEDLLEISDRPVGSLDNGATDSRFVGSNQRR